MGNPKPPNPQGMPKSWGKKPRAPKPRTGRDMGKSSSSATAPVIRLAFALFIGLPLMVVALGAYVMASA